MISYFSGGGGASSGVLSQVYIGAHVQICPSYRPALSRREPQGNLPSQSLLLLEACALDLHDRAACHPSRSLGTPFDTPRRMNASSSENRRRAGEKSEMNDAEQTCTAKCGSFWSIIPSLSPKNTELVRVRSARRNVTCRDCLTALDKIFTAAFESSLETFTASDRLAPLPLTAANKELRGIRSSAL